MQFIIESYVYGDIGQQLHCSLTYRAGFLVDYCIIVVLFCSFHIPRSLDIFDNYIICWSSTI